MRKYEPHPLELTPVLFQPTMLKVTWTLHLLAHRDHALWRVEAHAGLNDDLVGMGMYPCPGPGSVTALEDYAARSVVWNIGTACQYLATPEPEPFPGPPHGGAPAA